MGESRSGRGGTLTQVNQTQKAKNVCSPSYVVFRSKTNVVILLDMEPTLREGHIQEE
jgi:hypothetical protein